MFEDNKFKVAVGNGKEVECDVLFTFQSQETHKHYMAFTDHTRDRAGNVNVFYAIFDPAAEEMSMTPIETEQEWAMVRELMAGLRDDVQAQITQKRREKE